MDNFYLEKGQKIFKHCTVDIFRYAEFLMHRLICIHFRF